MGEYVTATEAARRYNISEKTIRTWIQKGKLPAKKIEGDGLDHWEIDTDEIEKAINRKKDGKLDIGMLPDVFAKLNELQERLDAIEEKIDAMTPPQNQEASTTIVETSRDIQPIAPQRTRLTPGETTLPTGYRAFTEYFRSHGIAETTANRAANAGIFTIETNGWKIDGVSVRKVLDPVAQRLFCRHFRQRSGSFRECEVSGCPCHE